MQRMSIVMKKRVAYIGISYPLIYDYEHQAQKCLNDLSDSPNPIIESPLGLMILYDELLFLCRSVCPNNMRNLPYVKFVDELYPDFDFENIMNCVDMTNSSIEINSNFKWWDIVKLMNIENWIIDSHTHGLKIGDLVLSARSTEEEFLFDMYVFQALQQLYDEDIELIANSKYELSSFNGGVEAEFVDKIILSDIPNYIGVNGPYHECMEELRENKDLKYFRKWIVEKHSNIQRTEINDMCTAVERNIIEVKDDVFRKYLDNNSDFSFYKSTGSTIIKTLGGLCFSPISIADAFGGVIGKGKEMLKAESVRWQGFVMDSRKTVKKIER